MQHLFFHRFVSKETGTSPLRDGNNYHCEDEEHRYQFDFVFHLFINLNLSLSTTPNIQYTNKFLYKKYK